MTARIERWSMVLAGGVCGVLVLGSVSGCAAGGDRPTDGPTAGGVAGADDPYAAVNTVAYDRGVWQQLLSDHTKIRRSVVYSPTGVDATTESDDPIVAARIKDHARSMQARIKAGARVRVWDPVFTDLFDRHGEVSLDVTETDRGVRISERASTPEAVALLWSHAAGVSEFVREGHRAGGRATARIPTGTPVPAPEVAIGGVTHRVLLAQPDAGQLALLKASGVGGVINLRTPAEQAGFDEATASASAGLTYTPVPFKSPEDLSDAVMDAAVAALREAESAGRTAALHCRTGNRAGPVWIAWRTLDGGVPIERAVAEAKMMQMVTPQYEAIARDYVRRKSGGG
ncbi:MAG: hypothetical protein HRU70_05145 [Phycisphaeraceae bacterium]|nr:MAG: hypothetical protein HRU70_05145 [Phycisphaeraceae bacterium]